MSPCPHFKCTQSCSRTQRCYFKRYRGGRYNEGASGVEYVIRSVYIYCTWYVYFRNNSAAKLLFIRLIFYATLMSRGERVGANWKATLSEILPAVQNEYAICYMTCSSITERGGVLPFSPSSAAEQPAEAQRGPRVACCFCQKKRKRCVVSAGETRCEHCIQRDVTCVFRPTKVLELRRSVVPSIPCMMQLCRCIDAAANC